MNHFLLAFMFGFCVAVMLLTTAFAVYVIDRLPKDIETGVKAALADYEVNLK